MIQHGILRRRGEVIDDAVAEERARNLTTIVEVMLNDFREEITHKGPAPTGEGRHS